MFSTFVSIMRILKTFSSFHSWARCQRVPQWDKINTLILSVAWCHVGIFTLRQSSKLKFLNNTANWLLSSKQEPTFLVVVSASCNCCLYWQGKRRRWGRREEEMYSGVCGAQDFQTMVKARAGYCTGQHFLLYKHRVVIYDANPLTFSC